MAQIRDALPSSLNHRWKNVRQTVHTYAKNTATRHPNSPGIFSFWSNRQFRKKCKIRREWSGRNQFREVKKKSWNLVVSGLLWQRVKDSNPHIQSQSLLCYLYTNPLYLLVHVARTGIIIPENKNLSRGFLKKIIFADFSRFQGIFPGKPPLRVHHQKQISLFRKWDPAQSLLFL